MRLTKRRKNLIGCITAAAAACIAGGIIYWNSAGEVPVVHYFLTKKSYVAKEEVLDHGYRSETTYDGTRVGLGRDKKRL